MNIYKIKKIKLQDFLATIDCKPVNQCGVNLMYLSPLRTEKHASFKVNTELNLWVCSLLLQESPATLSF